MLEAFKSNRPEVKVIIITGYSDIKTAVEIIKRGAFDYISKPLIPDEVMAVIRKALESASPIAATPPAPGEIPSLQKKKEAADPASGFLVGESPAIREVYRRVKLVAPTDYSVILYGESGTGKEVMARTIHQYSRRQDKPFVALDCGTLSRELAGSELFGHIKGAFTGAFADRTGHFEMANGGTLFLDEVANLSYDIQASLLRVIQERCFRRIGGTREMQLDIRLIIASNENLETAYRQGKFREDLFHRFNEFSLTLPPLRERQTDIPLFVHHFLEQTNAELGKNIQGFEEEVMNIFMQYSWPGNIREMKNVIRRAVLMSASDRITRKCLPWEQLTRQDKSVAAAPRSEGTRIPAPVVLQHDNNLKEAAWRAEWETILSVLKQVKYNKSKAAQLLNIDRKTLYNKLRNLESQGLTPN
ncbi:sigma-54 dependent transcriptional regulator [Compostibacter hankyongensis]|uniref:Sigma-54 dependent transcriptional regulator n=2 Tax=Compostibacter hankyongensis TaxID=1007089 RepID=A0ABP8FW49_9BACT